MSKEQMEFLLLPPTTWHILSSFKRFKELASCIPVVNDSAERNVKLIQDFINSSHNEDLRQDLLLAVESKRKSDAKKSIKEEEDIKTSL